MKPNKNILCLKELGYAVTPTKQVMHRGTKMIYHFTVVILLSSEQLTILSTIFNLARLTAERVGSTFITTDFYDQPMSIDDERMRNRQRARKGYFASCMTSLKMTQKGLPRLAFLSVLFSAMELLTKKWDFASACARLSLSTRQFSNWNFVQDKEFCDRIGWQMLPRQFSDWLTNPKS